MQLVGVLDSPYVRRVAISAKLLGVSFEHRPLSTIRNFDEFASINPVVKGPTLVLDDGTVLLDSTLIIDHVEGMVGREHNLMPRDGAERVRALRLIGLALAACEKAVQIVYERTLRPPEKQHQPWLDRIVRQVTAAFDLLEREIEAARPWTGGERVLQADVTVAVAWRFTQEKVPDVVQAAHYPTLSAFSRRAEALPEFASTPLG